MLQSYRYYFNEGKLVEYKEKLNEVEVLRERSKGEHPQIMEKAKALSQLLSLTIN